jgi:uncharacterized protein (DUF427 family)
VIYVEPFPRRVRGLLDGTTVVDSDRVELVIETGLQPRYSFPAEDVNGVESRPDRANPGHVRVAWDAVDQWFEEDQQVDIHVRDPYHRIDVVPTSRHVQVSVDGTVVADTKAARGLYETGLPTRWYIPRTDVRMELLQPSDTITHCPYKGTPVHWSARIGDAVVDDVAWSYDEGVRREAEDVRGYLAFYNERTDIDVDGERAERPATAWAR